MLLMHKYGCVAILKIEKTSKQLQTLSACKHIRKYI